MFAVIKTGGKQYRVAQDDEIIVEKLAGDAGEQIVFEDVLMLGEGGKVTLGEPLVAGASVVGEIAEQRKGEKVLIYKKRQRSTYRRKKGHRQLETVVKITSILEAGQKPAAAKKKAAPRKTQEAAPAVEAKAKPAKAEAKLEGGSKTEAKAADAGADDLKKLKGVGKVLEGKLHEVGLTSFAQIAALKEDEIAALEEKLGIAGRFERDDWIAQAADLANEG